jgi:hypothetical protein
MTSYKATEASRIGRDAAQMAMIGEGECADLYAKLAAHYALEAMYEQFLADNPIRQIEGGYTFGALESLFGDVPTDLHTARLQHRSMWEHLWNYEAEDRLQQESFRASNQQ